MSTHNPKYKDSNPSDTIRRAQSILEKLGFSIQENLLRPTNSLYSLRLNDKKTGWGVNGKGTTEEYCRASAYGEAIERILNLHFPDYAFLGQDTNENNCYPDEIEMSLSVESIPQEVFMDMQESFFEGEGRRASDNELTNLWRKWNGNNKCKAIPFFSVKNRQVKYLPFKILQRLCRSNGIAAGNSIPEAVCQAICEILERHSLETILKNELTPPEISRNFISSNYENINILLCEIEDRGLNVSLFDGSLGKDIPVIFALVIDQVNQSYRLKVGCHPKMEIAMERCITEFVQGNDISNTSKYNMLIPWNRQTNSNWNSFYSWSKHFRSNTGSIPDSFFYAKSSWPFRNWDFRGNYSNVKGCDFLIKKCLELSSDVYIRDNSIPGFSAVRVYVPFITKVYKFNPLSLNTFIDDHIKTIINNFREYSRQLSSDDRKKLIHIFSGDYHAIYSERLGVSVPVLLGALYMDEGNHKLALESLQKEKNKSNFIRGVISDLEMELQQYSKENRNRLLKLFYGDKVFLYIETNWRQGSVTSGLFDPYRINALRGMKEAIHPLDENWTQLICKTKALLNQYSINQNHLNCIFNLNS